MYRTLIAFLLTVSIGLTGCSSAVGGSPVGTEDPLSEEVLNYGAMAKPGPEITLQPDVIVVGGGARSVHSVTADGLTWSIDPAAAKAADLAPGKVMFLTGRAVGRVLHVQRRGEDLDVTLGPVDLTEVIKDGTFERPAGALGEPVVIPAGEPFWADPDAPLPPPNFAGDRPLRLSGAPPGRPAQPPATRGGRVDGATSGFTVYGSCCTDGIGAHFDYFQNGTKVGGTVLLAGSVPMPGFHLSIVGGRVTRAELDISAGFGFKASLYAGTESGQNISREFELPGNFSFPIAHVFGVPLSFSVGQSLKVSTALGTKSGTIQGEGEYALAGKLGFGYSGGSFGAHIAKNFQTKQSMLESLTGVSVGVIGLNIEHRVRFTVGFDAKVFQAGVYLQMENRLGIVMGSALGAPLTVCRGVGAGFFATYGVGFSVLQPVVDVINKFLDLIDVKPIANEYGIKDTAEIASGSEYHPDKSICKV